VVGFKPSFGKISVAGVKSLSPSLDTLGCFGRTIEDVGLGVAVMSGDHRLAKIELMHNKPRIGICKTDHWASAQQETATALAVARYAAEAISKGVVADIQLPKGCKDLTLAQTRIMMAETSRSFVFERQHFAKKLSAQFSKSLLEGAQISYEQYVSDLVLVNNARASLSELFNTTDILIAPSASGEAPISKEGTGNPIFCRDWTILGLPCLNINVSSGPNGLPVGIQLIAGPGKDHLLLSVARSFALALPDPVLRSQA
jgi:Asp-tRNA(Asn)/Glu-tRNA(Gln) amidotransferase A subunit family amidase